MNDKAEKFIKNYIDNFKSAKNDIWNYEDGCILNGAIMMYEATKEEKYKDFVIGYFDKYINEDGTINFYDTEEFNIANAGPGVALFFAFEMTGNEKYKKAIEVIMDQLRKQPRTELGNIWHKKIYPEQIWLDGMYMCHVFYMMYETKFGGKEHYNDIISQFKNVRKLMRNDETGLYYQAFDASKKAVWADAVTGTSPEFWLRGMGWYLMALIDTMSSIDQAIYEYYRDLQDLFKEAVVAVMKYQDKETGMFYQVIDKAGEQGNYIETSGSAMIAYAILKACRMKVLLAEKYEENALRILDGIAEFKIEDTEGRYELAGICSASGIGGKENKTGSLKDYFEGPVVSDDHKGAGPLIMAYAEALKIN